MLKYTANTWNKLQTLYKEGGYQVRFGKGSFNTGYCVLETKKVVVVNRYHSLEAKINALVDLLQKINLEETNLSEKNQKWYQQLKGKKTEEK